MNAKRIVHLVAIVLLASGCAKSESAYSGETHFMAVCDGECEAGLHCICGVCTHACVNSDDCRARSPAATCGGPGTPSGSCASAAAAATCSVPCTADTDCAELGDRATCVVGECRVNAQGSCLRAGTLYPDGTDGIAAGDACNTCRCNGGELLCTREDCEGGGRDAGAGDGGAVGGTTTAEPRSGEQADAARDAAEARPALATLSGTLAVDDGIEVDRASLRIALVWYPAGFEGPPQTSPPSAPCANPEGLFLDYRGLVAQELELDPTLAASLRTGDAFPLPFTVQITEAPPAAALRPVPVDDTGEPGSWSAGRLIAYEDRNGNGRLDSSLLAESAQDVVRGTSSDWHALVGSFEDVDAWYDIYYADVDVTSVGPPIERGFNLRQIINDVTAGYPSAIVPLDTPLRIEMRASPRIQTLNCEELCMLGDDTFSCPSDVAAVPAGGVVECNGAFDLLWSRATCEGCTCTTLACSLSSAFSEPADWPCP